MYFYPIGVILVGMNNGFSAIAIPDIMAEYTRFLTENTTESYLTPIQADMEQLSWFGRFSYTYSYFELHTVLDHHSILPQSNTSRYGATLMVR